MLAPALVEVHEREAGSSRAVVADDPGVDDERFECTSRVKGELELSAERKILGAIDPHSAHREVLPDQDARAIGAAGNHAPAVRNPLGSPALGFAGQDFRQHPRESAVRPRPHRPEPHRDLGDVRGLAGLGIHPDHVSANQVGKTTAEATR
jgi:hypothetical protein